MTTTHLTNPAQSEYTMCGLAGDAHESGDHPEQIVFAKRREAVTCADCRRVVLSVLRDWAERPKGPKT